MYGLVNQAFQAMAVEYWGEDCWLRIRQRAAVEVESFSSMVSYPDEITYGLAGATIEELDLEAQELLRQFGRFWVKFVSYSGYEQLLAVGGSTVRELLLGLDDLHTRLALSLPELAPPSFACKDVTDSGLTLQYHSKRSGLAYFVCGLVEGLGHYSGEEVSIEISRERVDPSDHDEFLVRYTPRTR